jgi:AcrR family transcriptional regulator
MASADKAKSPPATRRAKAEDEARATKLPRAIGRPAGKRSVGKEVLIEKTIELLRKLPPEKLSLTAAAHYSGVHLTLFKYYFQDRTRLLVDVARHLALEIGNRVKAAEQADTPAPERLRVRIDAMVDFYFLNPFYHRLMLEILADEKDELAGELINLWMTRTLEIYRDIIDGGVREGTLRPMDERYTFLALMGLCEQFHHGLRLFDKGSSRGKLTQEDAATDYKAFLYDLMFNGLATRHGAVSSERRAASPAPRKSKAKE